MANGNISAFLCLLAITILRLKGGSPAIDAGNNATPHLPLRTVAGCPRIINGNGGPTAIVDMGAYEFVPVVLAPKSLSFGLQAVGSTTNKTVKLTHSDSHVPSTSKWHLQGIADCQG